MCVFFCHCIVILEKTIRIPRSLSVKAAGVLKGFLNKVPSVCSLTSVGDFSHGCNFPESC